MAESTLSLSINDLQAEIGHFLGYGRGVNFSEPAWTLTQTNNINAVLKSGLSQVYTPPPIGPNEVGHNWSWLRPFASITILQGTYTIALPDDFGGFEGPIYVNNATSARRRWLLPVTNEGMVQQRIVAYPDTTGPPQLAAEYVLKGTSLSAGTRSDLAVWPKTDQNYTLTIQYKYLPDALTGLLPYPPGGAEHAELFKASCLAAAELQLDDSPGPRAQFFMQRLTASVHVDRKRKGQKLGYNGDNSDRRSGGVRAGFRDDRYYDGEPVTYNGTDM